METNVPFSQDEWAGRLGRLHERLASKNLPGLVAFSGYQDREGHVAYLTNHRSSFPNTMTHLGLGYAALVVPAGGMPVLVAPGGYEPAKVTGINCAFTGDALVPEIGKALKLCGLDSGPVGVAGLDVIPAEYYLQLQQEYPRMSFETANDLLESLRMIKSPAEIELLRRAAWAADAGLQAGLEAVRPGVSGLEIERQVRSVAMDAGAEFIPRVRVVSGKKLNALVWPQVDPRRLEPGDLVFIDLIGWRSGYGFDCSRVAVAGEPSDGQAALLLHLAEATEWMIETLKPGKTVTYYMAESRGREINAFGHGIGLEIMETPFVTLKKPVQLKPGMVLCIEPTVGSPGTGHMSAENMVVITPTGVEVLNRLPLAGL